jgi:hypothetical protein
VVAHGEDALPARHGVRADDGVDCLEELAHVLGRAPLGAVQLEAVALCRLVEAWLGVGCREGVEEALEGLRDAVVDLVAGCPEGVCLVVRLLARSGRFAKANTMRGGEKNRDAYLRQWLGARSDEAGHSHWGWARK